MVGLGAEGSIKELGRGGRGVSSLYLMVEVPRVSGRPFLVAVLLADRLLFLRDRAGARGGGRLPGSPLEGSRRGPGGTVGVGAASRSSRTSSEPCRGFERYAGREP